MGEPLSILFILGMHRGGTSAVARMVNLLGAELGRDLLDAQPDINAEGFWENRHVVALNEDLLSRMDSAWYDPRPLPAEWWATGGIPPFGATIRKILADQYPEKGLIAIKDPRLCRLFPLWRAALAKTPVRAACILVARRPEEVVRSIARRDGFDEDSMRLLWLLHMLEAEFHSRDFPRGVVLYDEVLDDWEKTAHRISHETGIQWSTAMENAAERIRADIRPDLKHHHLAENDDEPASGLDGTARAVYEILASGRVAARRDELDRIRLRLREDAALSGERDEMLFRNIRLLAGTNRGMNELGRMHTRALEVIAERDRQLEETNRHLNELGQMHTRALEVIGERDRLIAKIQSHWTWRITRRLI